MLQEQYDFSIKNNFHRMTRYELGEYCKNHIKSLHKFKFSEIKPDCVIYRHKSYGGDDGNLFVVHSVTASGKQVVVSDYDVINHFAKGTYKIYSGSYGHYDFSKIEGDDLLLIGLDHEQIVTYAANAKLSDEIPVKVKMEYPTLFVEIPERFSADRVKNTLSKNWCGKRFVTKDQILEWVVSRHEDIRKLEAYLPCVRTKNPGNVQDYEKYIEDYRHDIDFYRWLQPLVSEGGVFYTE